MTQVHLRVLLLAAVVLPLLAAGCVVSPPVQEIRPASTPEAPVVSPPAAIPSLPLPAGEPASVPPPAAASVPTEASLPAVAEPAAADEPAPLPAPLPTAEDAPAREEGVKGIASYYAKRFNGRPTTSGVPYDPDKLTAAHQSLPFGTRVKVVNLANGREVTVTVNDRCRKRKSPFIDLSRAAAKQLGFFGKGITKVRIIPLDSGEQ